MSGEMTNIDYGNLDSEQLEQLFKDLWMDDIINGPLRFSVSIFDFGMSKMDRFLFYYAIWKMFG